MLQHDKALIDCNKAIEIDEYYKEAYLLKSVVCFHLGEYSLALQSLNHILENIETEHKREKNERHLYCKLLNSRGLIYKQMNNFSLAQKDFDKAIYLDDYKYRDIYYNRGVLYYDIYEKFKKNMFREAINDFTKVLELNDEDYLAYKYRGVSYYQIAQQHKDDKVKYKDILIKSRQDLDKFEILYMNEVNFDISLCKEVKEYQEKINEELNNEN
jgi:tetratricopeptide (TPR) repeat protein